LLLAEEDARSSLATLELHSARQDRAKINNIRTKESNAGSL
jgi:hypothetical protein